MKTKTTNLHSLEKEDCIDFLENDELANESFDLAVKLFPNDAEVLVYRGRFL